MAPTYSVKKGNRRYPYYVSTPIVGERKVPVGDLSRVPAHAIDKIINNRIGALLNLEPDGDVDNVLAKRVLNRVTVYADSIELEVNHGKANVDVKRLETGSDEIVHMERFVLVRIRATLRKHSRKLAFVNGNGYEIGTAGQPDRVLVKNIATAHRLRDALESGTFDSVRALARSEDRNEGYIRKLLPLAYLAPDIVESILDGKQPPALDLNNFTLTKLPVSWKAQRKLLGYENA